MNLSRAMSPNSNCTQILSLHFLPEELIVLILSSLPVKSLMQLRCVRKSWNTLFSDPKFIKLHLQQSKKNRSLTQILCMSHDSYVPPFPLNTLLNNPSIIKSIKNYFPSNPYCRHQFIGSCNGLFCFLLTLYPQKTWFQLWNPAANTFSIYFGQHSNSHKNVYEYDRFFRFSFGFDNSTNTYKVLSLGPNKVEIFTRNSVVRTIDSLV